MSAAVLTATLGRSQETSGVASVVEVNGSAFVVGAKARLALKKGDRLRPGSVVEVGTEPGAHVDLAFVAGDRPMAAAADSGAFASCESTAPPDTVRLWDGSQLAISRLDFVQTGNGVVANIRLGLKQGRVTGLVKKRGAPSTFAVAVPDGTVLLRENLYDLSAGGHIKAAAAPMIWYDGDSRTPRTITAGESFDVRTGETAVLSSKEKLALADTASALMLVPDPAPALLSADQTTRPISPHHPRHPHPPHPPHF